MQKVPMNSVVVQLRWTANCEAYSVTSSLVVCCWDQLQRGHFPAGQMLCLAVQSMSSPTVQRARWANRPPSSFVCLQHLSPQRHSNSHCCVDFQGQYPLSVDVLVGWERLVDFQRVRARVELYSRSWHIPSYSTRIRWCRYRQVLRSIDSFADAEWKRWSGRSWSGYCWSSSPSTTTTESRRLW